MRFLNQIDRAVIALQRMTAIEIDDCPICDDKHQLDHVVEIRPGVFVPCCKGCHDEDRR